MFFLFSCAQFTLSVYHRVQYSSYQFQHHFAKKVVMTWCHSSSCGLPTISMDAFLKGITLRLTLRCNILDVFCRTYCNIVGGFVEVQPLLRDALLFPIFSSSKVTLLMKAVGWIVVLLINTSRDTIPLHNIGSTMFDAFLLHFLHCVLLVRLCSQLCSSEKDLLNKWFDFAGLFVIRVGCF